MDKVDDHFQRLVVDVHRSFSETAQVLRASRLAAELRVNIRMVVTDHRRHGAADEITETNDRRRRGAAEAGGR